MITTVRQQTAEREKKMNYIRTACVSPKVHIGNTEKNYEELKSAYMDLKDKCDILVTPELSITGYTCGDLFGNRLLIDRAQKVLLDLKKLTKEQPGACLVVGLPLEYENELYNCAAFLCRGEILGIVPKMYLPNYSEFYEKRWFSEGVVLNKTITLTDKSETLFGNDLIFELTNGEEKVRIGVEICEDAWTSVSPGTMLALNGAEIILNLSASNEVIGKEEYRRMMLKTQTAANICGYVYTSAGMYESTSDIVFSAHNMILENGKLLAESQPFASEEGRILSDISLTKLRHDRLANKSYGECRKNNRKDYRKITASFSFVDNGTGEILQKVSITPFVPEGHKLERCLSIFHVQVAGLQRRLEATRPRCIVVGVSGGLDSTLALLVSAQAVKNLGLPSKTVVGVTMPGFGTTNRTKNNSHELMKILGCDIREISIVDSVRQHFKDIGQDESVMDITYENCQARERTQILMDLANKEGGFVIGTGDLSELALGWCTYNGDHMSMYAVNVSIPKTLVKTLVYEIGMHMEQNGFTGMREVIQDIVDTPVSPELLPPKEDGTIAQKTEDTVGSYVLHDFFLYYTLRFGMTPKEVYRLCNRAVEQSADYKFSAHEIKKWMKVFYTRFFRQQFKRNCMPDGVKVGTVSVSPRGDLRLPSEIEMEEFIKELDALS